MIDAIANSVLAGSTYLGASAFGASADTRDGLTIVAGQLAQIGASFIVPRLGLSPIFGETSAAVPGSNGQSKLNETVNGSILAGDAGSVKGVNPTGSTQNCTNCVAVVGSLLTTGNPASALPRATPVPFAQLGQIYGTKFSRWTSQQKIEMALLASGEGTRAVIYGTDGAYGHVWNAVVQNGEVNYIDGQIGGGGAGNFRAFTNFQFGVLK